MHSTIINLNIKISYIMAENATRRQQLGGGGMFLPPSPTPPRIYPHLHIKKIGPLPTHICIGKSSLCVTKGLLIHIQKVKKCVGKCL